MTVLAALMLLPACGPSSTVDNEVEDTTDSAPDTDVCDDHDTIEAVDLTDLTATHGYEDMMGGEPSGRVSLTAVNAAGTMELTVGLRLLSEDSPSSPGSHSSSAELPSESVVVGFHRGIELECSCLSPCLDTVPCAFAMAESGTIAYGWDEDDSWWVTLTDVAFPSNTVSATFSGTRFTPCEPWE